MKLCRYLLLILLTVAVPVSGYASVTMQLCHVVAQASGGHEHHHHAGMMMAGMTASEHQHMHDTTPEKTVGDSKASTLCKCGCPCDGHCPPGSCAGAVALLFGTLFLSDFSGSKQMTYVVQPHALTAPPFDHLRPPISAAT